MIDIRGCRHCGDSDVGDIMWIIMLATFFVMLVIFSMYLIGHQHLKHVTIWSPKSVTNIDVTVNLNVATSMLVTYVRDHLC